MPRRTATPPARSRVTRPVDVVWGRVASLRATRFASPMLRRAARRRAGAWCAAAGLALVVHQVVDDADTRQRTWGRTRTVVVAARRIEAGTLLDAHALTLTERPVAVLPDDTLRTIEAGQRATRSIERGEELTSADAAPSGRSPVASQLQPGRSAVVVHLGDTAPPVGTGDRVDVVTDLETSGAPAAATVIAHGATVITVDGDQVVLSVPEAEAAATAHAALVGSVSIVVRR